MLVEQRAEQWYIPDLEAEVSRAAREGGGLAFEGCVRAHVHRQFTFVHFKLMGWETQCGSRR